MDIETVLAAMVQGHKRLYAILPDTVEILFNLEEANWIYADSLDINPSELTDTQKKEAFAIAALSFCPGNKP